MSVIQKTLIERSGDYAVLSPVQWDCVGSIRIASDSATEVEVKIYITQTPFSPGEDQCIEYGAKIAPKGVYIITGELIGMKEGVTVKVPAGNGIALSVRVSALDL